MEHIDDYLASKSAFPISTRTTIRNGLQRFAEFADPIERDPSNYKRNIIMQYRQWLAKPYEGTDKQMHIRRPRTIQLYTGIAQRFLLWLSISGYMNRLAYLDIADYTKANSSSPRTGYVARPIDPELDKLLHHYVNMPLPAKGVARLILLRNRALVVFLYDTACRIGEALALTRADVADGRTDIILLRETKGSVPRSVMIGQQTRQLLREYITERRDTSNAPLFLSHGRGKGNGLSVHRAWEIIGQAAEAEGLMDSTSPHSLRHMRAQNLLDAGMPVEWIASLLGHKRLTTTKDIYAPWVNRSTLAEMLKKYGKEPLDA